MPGVGNWTGHSVDVAVVGAGAAGLAAARHLADRRPDLTLLVLEAADRIGGRALTLDGDLPLDLGCGWLHGAQDNAWTGIAEAIGFTVDRTPAPWNRVLQDSALKSEDRQAARAALWAFFDRIDARRDPAVDRPLSSFLEAGNRWNGFIGAVGTYINGVELEAASTVDYRRYKPGRPPDWRVKDGYGRMIAAYGAALPVALSTAVTRIAHGRREGGIAIETSRGTLACRAAVVTVFSTCLAEETIRFDPPLPDTLAAAAGVPLGVANKIFVDLAEPEALPAESYLHGSTERVGTGSFHIRPFGRPVIECYYGGVFARAIEAMAPEAAFDVAASELESCFGSALRGTLSLRARSTWAGNPWTRGSYSYAKPGEADARAVLATPVNDRLFFAGEACSPHRFSTAHGAFETGVASATAIAESL